MSVIAKELSGYIDSDFLKTALEWNGDINNVTIQNYTISKATADGDHFASAMFQVIVLYCTDVESDRKCSLIIKALPSKNGPKSPILNDPAFDLFRTEIRMYSEILPKITKILKNVGYNEQFWPNCLYTVMAPHKMLVLEDMKEPGYFVFSNPTPNEVEAKIVYSKLAQFHAATLFMQSEGNKNTRMRGTILNFPGFKNLNVFAQSLPCFVDLVETLPGFENAAEKLRRISFNKLVDKCIRTINKSGVYNVLNHGDFHIRNLMFKNDDSGNIAQTVMIDFQLCHWGSPAIDLCYIASVVPYKMRKKLIEWYFDEFIGVLMQFGYKGTLPTIEELQEELRLFRILDFFMLITFTSYYTLLKEELSLEARKWRQTGHLQSIFKKPVYLEFIMEILPILLEEGVLDDNGLFDDFEPRLRNIETQSKI